MNLIALTYILFAVLPISQVFNYFIHPMIPRNRLKTPLDDTDNTTNLVFIDRAKWGALPVTEPEFKLDIIPAPYLMIYHTGTAECFARETCDRIVRNLQKKYFTDAWNRDIGYNFIISGDGNIYIGRGWDIVGAHTLDMNRKSIGIALIGSFNNKSLSIDQFSSLHALIRFGIKRRHIAQNFEFYSYPESLVSFKSAKRVIY